MHLVQEELRQFEDKHEGQGYKIVILTVFVVFFQAFHSIAKCVAALTVTCQTVLSVQVVLSVQGLLFN